MIFEFPFDLIVMTRTNPPIPTHPMLYRQLFFLPLFPVEFSTLSLLILLPSMRITAYACYAVAAMFVVFANALRTRWLRHGGPSITAPAFRSDVFVASLPVLFHPHPARAGLVGETEECLHDHVNGRADCSAPNPWRKHGHIICPAGRAPIITIF
jgi:hypothetical protein